MHEISAIENMQFIFNHDKNEKLIFERNISFNDVITAIYAGNRGYLRDHHNLATYPNQKILYIEINAYFYVVPYVAMDDGQTLFLKTIYRSSKVNKILQTKGAV